MRTYVTLHVHVRHVEKRSQETQTLRDSTKSRYSEKQILQQQLAGTPGRNIKEVSFGSIVVTCDIPVHAPTMYYDMLTSDTSNIDPTLGALW